MAVSQTLNLYQVSQDLARNSSKLRILWKSTQTNDSHNNNTRTAYYYVSVNGGAETKYSVSYTLPKNTTKTILDVTLTVPHNDEGKCTVAVRTWMDTRISAGEVTKSASITLTPIPRANTITASDAVIGKDMKITVARKSASYLHSVLYKFGALTGTVVEKSASSEITFRVPDSWGTQLTTTKSGTATLICVTYSGDTEIGQSTATANISTDSSFAPAITADVVDINSATIALTGDAKKLILNASTARATISATPLRGATISSTTINGVKTAALEVQNVQSAAFEFSAIDSRGWESKKTVKPVAVPYVPLSALVSQARGAQGADDLTVTVKGNYYNGSFGSAANSLSFQYRADGGAWTAFTPAISGNTYSASIALSLDYQTSHKIELRIADRIKTLSPTVSVPRAVPITMEGENFIRHNVPVYQVLPRYDSNSDDDESKLEAWLEGLLNDMPNMASMDIAWNCYPAVTGTTVFAKLSRYSSANYAVVCGASYDGRLYLKYKNNTWKPTKKVVIE